MFSEVSVETAFPRDSWRVGVMEVGSSVHGWGALGKAVLAETEPESITEP